MEESIGREYFLSNSSPSSNFVPFCGYSQEVLYLHVRSIYTEWFELEVQKVDESIKGSRCDSCVCRNSTRQ